MTEYNLFCYSKEYNDENSFQQARYRAFNKEVGEVRYYELLDEVRQIIPNPNKLLLKDFWKSITAEQWNKLLAIPEAKDFKEGFEFISGVKICTEKTIVIDGKEIKISNESFEALKEQLLEGLV
jgi:hypothetical protein